MRRSRLVAGPALACIALTRAPATATELYWTEFGPPPATGGISRADVQTLLPEPIIPSGLPSPYRIAVDPVGRMMYWTSTQGGGLRRAELDGTDMQTIVPAGGGPFLGLTIDVEDRKVIWSHGTQLRRANLDGSDVQTFNGLGATIQDVTLDPLNEKIYFSDSGLANPGRLRRMNYDGSGLETVISGIAAGPVGLAVDSAAGDIFFGTFAIGAPTGGVQRANLDGSGVETIVPGIDVDSMALDSIGGQLYWTTSNDTVTDGAIWRSSLDGSGAQELALGDFVPGGVTIIPEPAAAVPWLLVLVCARGDDSRFPVPLRARTVRSLRGSTHLCPVISQPGLGLCVCALTLAAILVAPLAGCSAPINANMRVAPERRPICLRCFSKRQVIPVMYGLPNGEALQAAERGEIELGGCAAPRWYPPSWYCKTCDHDF